MRDRAQLYLTTMPATLPFFAARLACVAALPPLPLHGAGQDELQTLTTPRGTHWDTHTHRNSISWLSMDQHHSPSHFRLPLPANRA